MAQYSRTKKKFPAERGWRILFVAATLVLLTTDDAVANRPTNPPLKNVLFIAVDDLRPELGCYGADYAKTPFIDAFSKRSVVFLNHFAQVPTCGASRYALLTGRSPMASGAFGNQAFYSGAASLSQVELPGAQSMPELFRRSGYETICIGKISHTPDGRLFDYRGRGDGRREVPHAWDKLATPFGKWKRGWGVFFAYANGNNREDGHDHNDVMQFIVERDDDLPDGMMATEAISTLERLKNQNKPFFLGLGFFKPHLPFVAPRADWEAFDKVNIPLPIHPDKSNSSYANNRSGEFFKYDFPYEKSRPLSDDNTITNRRAYLACVRYTDRQIGRVLHALESNGLRESTIVIIWSDHGWNLGDSRQWGKHTPLERAVRSPLLISVPGLTTKGSKTESLVESIDVFPTLIELCQPSFTKTEKPLDGHSLVPVLKDPKAKIRELSVSYWNKAVSIRSSEYRLVGRLADKGTGILRDIELYSADQQFDPILNLATDHPEAVSEMTQKFQIRLTKDVRNR